MNLIPPNPVPGCPTPHLCRAISALLILLLCPSSSFTFTHLLHPALPILAPLSFPQSCVHSPAHTDTHASLWSLDAELSLRKQLPTRDAFLL